MEDGKNKNGTALPLPGQAGVFANAPKVQKISGDTRPKAAKGGNSQFPLLAPDRPAGEPLPFTPTDANSSKCDCQKVSQK
jgi:hypothetical protein